MKETNICYLPPTYPLEGTNPATSSYFRATKVDLLASMILDMTLPVDA